MQVQTKYYKHSDGSVALLSRFTSYGKKMINFRTVHDPSVLYNREKKLKPIGDRDEDRWYVEIQDTFLIKTGGQFFYLHYYDPPKEPEKTTETHLYQFIPTEEEKKEIEDTVQKIDQEIRKIEAESRSQRGGFW
jgi:hypothetical protein